MQKAEGRRRYFCRGSDSRESAIFPEGDSKEGSIFPKGDSREGAIFPEGDSKEGSIFPKGDSREGGIFAEDDSKVGGIFPGVGSKVGRSVFTEDISLEGGFLQRAIAERAVVFTRVVTEWYCHGEYGPTLNWSGGTVYGRQKWSGPFLADVNGPPVR